MTTLAMLVGGGPAPGLNGVIQAVTQAARARGWKVLGVPEGFKPLIAGDVARVRDLTEADVAVIGGRGGSILFTSRANPAKEPEGVAKVVASLGKLGAQYLVTIGGDDTATSAFKVAQASGGKLRVAHVPKTIDNDLPLPAGAPTFGFETARQLGAQLVGNLVEDARTTRRFYLVTVMGRTAGHLSAGVAMSAGADLTLLPEELGERLRFEDVVDRVELAVLKRLAAGQPYGTIVLAEGLLYRMDPASLGALQHVEKDEHGHARVSEIPFGKLLKDALGRLKQRGVKADFVAKEVGYEVRCQDPCAFDAAYTRALGLGAVQFLASGQGHAMLTVQQGNWTPIPLDALQDPATGKTRVRLFDPTASAWRAHAALEARLRKADLQGPALEALAKAGKLEPQTFVDRFARYAED